MGHFGLAHYVAWGKREKTSAGDEDNGMTQCDSRACQTAIATRECNRGFPLVYTVKLGIYVFPAFPQLISFISFFATNKGHELLPISPLGKQQ